MLRRTVRGAILPRTVQPLESTPPSAAKLRAEQAATRSRPRSTIAFDRPIIGPTGARLVSYTWQWKPIELVNVRGDDVVRRISDWDKSERSADTGREVVHQFEVDVDGHVQLVSAQSALKLLGFFAQAGEGTTESGRAAFNALSSAAKTLARLQMRQAEITQIRQAFDADMAQVVAMPLPPMPQERVRHGTTEGWWVMGDAAVRQLEPGPMRDERRRVLVESWRDNRMAERGWSLASHLGQRFSASLHDVGVRIETARRRLDSAQRAAAEAGQPDEAAQPERAAAQRMRG